MSESTDKFKKVAPNTGWQVGGGGVADASVTTIPLVSSTSLPTGTGVILTIDRVDSSGTQTPTKMERSVGVISGTNVISCVRGIGGTAQAHSPGAVVEIVIDSVLWNDLMDGILAEHNQDGSHKLAAITSAIQTWDGWVTANNTWSAVDANTISVNADITSLIQKGDKIKVTNNSAVKYFYVSTIPVFATGATTFDVAGEVDLVAGTITLPCYSKIDSPQGFKDGRIWYKARAYKSVTQNKAGGSTKVTLDTETYDVNSNFDNVTNSRYTAPISGYYKITGRAGNIADSSMRIFTTVYKNGVEILRGSDDTSVHYISVISDEVYLTKGDYIELYVYTGTSCDLVYGAVDTCFLTVQFISI